MSTERVGAADNSPGASRTSEEMYDMPNRTGCSETPLRGAMRTAFVRRGAIGLGADSGPIAKHLTWRTTPSPLCPHAEAWAHRAAPRIRPRRRQRPVKVTVDEDRCRGHGMCLTLCPEVFRVTEDGYAVADPTDVPAEWGQRWRTPSQTVQNKPSSKKPFNQGDSSAKGPDHYHRGQ